METINTNLYQFPTTKKDKVEANLAAIRLVKRLEEEGKQATDEDKVILSKYVGWGGLANDVFDKKATRFAKEREEIENLVTKEEYKAMELSSLTAYYTSQEVATQMWTFLEQNGFKGGNILDPSMGTGIFFHTMPESIRQNSKLYGIELDTLTGAIAKQLYPEATIYIKGFEDVNFIGENFDLVMSNVPFADIRIADIRIVDKRYSNKPYLIHDYFIKKSLDIVREGGVVSVITSIGSSDKRSGSVLPELAKKASFLGGVRLPNNTFKEIAGTSVITDILYFHKSNQNRNSDLSVYFEKPIKSSLDTEGRLFVNPYFLQESGQDNPQVLGDYEVRFYNGATLSLKPVNTVPFKEQLNMAFSNINAPKCDMTSEALEVIVEEENQVNKELRELLNIRMHEFEADENGNIFYRDHNGVRPAAKIVEITRWNDKDGVFSHWDAKASEKQIEDFEKRFKDNPDILVNTYESSEVSKRGANKGFYKVVYFYEVPQEDSLRSRMLGMIALKHAYQKVIDIQLQADYSENKFKAFLNDLNAIYDGFVKKFGFINSPVNSRTFSRDDRYPLIASLEEEVLDEKDSSKIVFIKTAAFTKPMVRPKRQLNVVSNAKDALNISLSEGLGVDFEVMTSVYPNSTKSSLLLELEDEISIDIQCYCATSNIRYVVKEAFLSGDVKTSRKLIGELIEKGDNAANWEHYLELIESVIPEDIALVDIDFKLGSVWIPKNVIGMFVLNTFGEEQVALDDELAHNIIVDTAIGRGFNETEIKHLFYKDTNIRFGLRSTEGLNKYSRGTDVVRYLLGSDQPTIKKNIGTSREPKYVEDTTATATLRELEAKIQELFLTFVKDNEEVAALVKETYNEKYNRYVTRHYDGSNLVFDGLANGFELRPHQKDAVQRILEDKRALLAHEVGTGKTLTMVSAGFKMKELGLVNKPLFVVPSSLTAQFGQEIMRFFPTKKVFVTTERDFEKSRRRLFISRIITGDYDGIVIGHSQFEKIKVSTEREKIFYEDRLDEIEAIIDYANENDDRISFKTAQAMKKRLELNLEKLSLRDDKDDFIDFEQLGIDMLFVDEAHSYKNIRPMTKLGSLPGICNVTAQKNIDMQMKIRSIQEEHNGTNVVFATGTPVSNSISEMFTMMSYIQPDVLEKHGVNNFDSWVGDFGVIETLFEVNTTGSEFISRKRFSRFTNLPELMALYRRTTDIKMTKDLDLPTPSVRQFAVKLEMTEGQKAFQDSLVARTEKIKSGAVEPSEDNMLKITSEARKASIDMRLIDPANYSLIDSNKLMQVVDRVMFIYEKESINRGTQMIFSDVGTPANTDFSVYRELKLLFMERGVPEDEIAFIHDAKNKDQKLQLQRKMNAGEIRILIASTEKGGTGLNVQRRLKAVHHLDIPWKPSDLIQRNGRCERQGNAYSQIFIYYYITKGSFDNYQFQIIESKLKFITTLWSGDNVARTADDIDEQTMTASDFKAIATGNPYLKLKMELENELGLLTNRKKVWERDKESSKKRVENAHVQIAHLQDKLANIDDDVALALATKPYTEEVVGADGKKTAVDYNTFSMTFESGFTTDKRDLAGNQLHFDLQNLVSDKPEMRTIATYRGFKLRAVTQQSLWRIGRIITINIVGKNSYPVELDFESPVGSIQRINNTINGIEKMRDKINRTIASYQVVISKGLPSDSFEQQARLDYVKAKFAVVQPLVDNNEAPSVIMKAVQEFDSDYNFDNNIQEEKKETQSSLEIFTPGFDYELEIIIESDAHDEAIEDNAAEQQELLAIADFLAEAQELLELFSGHSTKKVSEEVVEVVQTSLFDELF